MSILEVNLLGVPEVRHNGVVYAIRLRKAVALLTFLALAGGLRSREEVAALLWPEAGERESRAALRTTLSALRQSMGERDGAPAALQVIAGAVGLDLNVVSIDVHELASAAALRHGQRSLLRPVLRLGLGLLGRPYLDVGCHHVLLVLVFWVAVPMLASLA